MLMDPTGEWARQFKLELDKTDDPYERLVIMNSWYSGYECSAEKAREIVDEVLIGMLGAGV